MLIALCEVAIGRSPAMPIHAGPSPLLLAAALVGAAAAPALARQPADLAGLWDLSFDKTGATCRIQLRADKSDKGDFFLGMPSACRHAMPGIAAVGRWGVPDDGHLTLDEPGGKALLALDASGDGFALAGPVGTYTLRPVATGYSAAPPAAPSATLAPAVAMTGQPPAALAPTPAPAPSEAAPVRKVRSEPAPSEAEIAGRYAVMREKRDTGCMVTLDRTRAKAGDRAQLAPGCRDQGIVVFDPSAWSLVRGELVLTARAGHKTKLERGEDGVWAKDPKEGGKPLGLKKL